MAAVLLVGCALLLAACGGDGDGENGGGAGDDGLSQKIYQGTQPSLGELDVGVGNILESGAAAVSSLDRLMTSSSSGSRSSARSVRSRDSFRIWSAASCATSGSLRSSSSVSTCSSAARSSTASSRRSIRLVDDPRVAGHQEFLEIAGALLLCRGAKLRLHSVTVYGCVDLPEDAERSRRDRPVGKSRQREGEARIRPVGVVHQQLALAHLGDVDYLELSGVGGHHAALVVRAEADRLSVLDVDAVLGLLLAGQCDE